MVAESGNGIHIMYRVDEPNDDSSRVDFEYATKMLSTIWSTPQIAVDVTSFNASRVWKIYGTISAKGSSTEDRPHRVAKITKLPKEFVLVTRDQLDTMARPLRDAKSDEYRDMTGEFIGDMMKWLTDRFQTVVSGPRPMFGNEGQKWIISKCPFNPEHQNPMVGLVNNRPVFKCLHNSCSAFKWKEYREKIDPTYKDPETIYARLVEWCNGGDAECDQELLQSASATGKKLAGILKKLRTDCARSRVNQLEEFLKSERRRFLRETTGSENSEKGNIVGLINRTRTYQAEGIVPMYWIADYDYRVRVGPVGDIECPKYGESDEIELMVKFHSMGDSWVKQTHCGQIIKHLATEYRVNPLKTFLKQKRWDGTQRLDTWLPHYMGTKDNNYTRAIGRKWLISAVARAMDPGCQADHMLILEGKQGIGKSQALRILGGQFYVEYSGGTKTGFGPQMVAVIIGKMIVEMSELAAMRRADMEQLKAMLTTPIDEVRLSYERDARSYPRTCVIAGTTNEVGQAYIQDQTGARRFWPTVAGEVGTVRTDLLKLDVDQIWAEAVNAYEEGEDWYTVPDEVAEEQADRQLMLEDNDPWYAKIRGALTDGDNYAEVWSWVPEFMDGQPTGQHVVRSGPMNVILGVILGIETSRQSPMDVIRVQKILRGIGFRKVRPSKKWFGSTYAYDLSRDVLPHMWSSIKAAAETIKFPKGNSVDSTTD
jgi:putative DNA primase/helicase